MDTVFTVVCAGMVSFDVLAIFSTQEAAEKYAKGCNAHGGTPLTAYVKEFPLYHDATTAMIEHIPPYKKKGAKK